MNQKIIILPMGQPDGNPVSQRPGTAPEASGPKGGLALFVPARHGQKMLAFTLIELLVVIAIIGILSSLVLYLLPRASNMKIRTRVRTELEQIVSAIEHYKEKRGYYPPDNPASAIANPLFYELGGTKLYLNGWYTNLAIDAAILAANLPPFLGVNGFVNVNKEGEDDPSEPAKNFIPTLKLSQARTNLAGANFLGIAVNGPATNWASGDFCPFFYNKSAPTHNPNSFDLWVEVSLGGTNKIFGNWRQD